jgi:hypothetical protein
MKARFIFTPIVLLVALSIILSSCTDAVNKLASVALNHNFEYEHEDTVKWGRIVEEDLNLPAFSAIDAEGLVSVVFTQHDSISRVRVRANQKCLDEYKFEVRKDELKVKMKKADTKIDKTTPGIILYVTAPALTGVELSGGGIVTLLRRIDIPGTLNIELNGACKLFADSLSVGELELEANGASKCDFAHIIAKENIEIEINGAGDIDANVFCQDLRIQMNGAGKGVFSGECKKLICEENGASKVDFSKLKR